MISATKKLKPGRAKAPPLTHLQISVIDTLNKRIEKNFGSLSRMITLEGKKYRLNYGTTWRFLNKKSGFNRFVSNQVYDLLNAAETSSQQPIISDKEKDELKFAIKDVFGGSVLDLSKGCGVNASAIRRLIRKGTNAGRFKTEEYYKVVAEVEKEKIRTEVK